MYLFIIAVVVFANNKRTAKCVLKANYCEIFPLQNTIASLFSMVHNNFDLNSQYFFPYLLVPYLLIHLIDKLKVFARWWTFPWDVYYTSHVFMGRCCWSWYSLRRATSWGVKVETPGEFRLSIANQLCVNRFLQRWKRCQNCQWQNPMWF